MIAAILKTFRGERSLATTYWVWGVLPAALLAVILGAQPFFSARLYVSHATLSSSIRNSLILFDSAFAFFFAVAIWRSAKHYKGSTVWRVLALVGAPGTLVGLALAAGSIDKSVSRHLLEQKISRAAQQLSVGLPMQLDNVTTLNAVSAVGTTLTYHLELTNAGEIEQTQLDNLRRGVTNKLCAGSENTRLLKLGTIFGYEYMRNGHIAIAFQIHAQDCNQT